MKNDKIEFAGFTFIYEDLDPEDGRNTIPNVRTSQIIEIMKGLDVNKCVFLPIAYIRPQTLRGITQKIIKHAFKDMYLRCKAIKNVDGELVGTKMIRLN